ncbi:hypothetical protein HDU97_010038 [Phlyctochytrium planicorne]|nr:hypothetical protein HDU97_010038 [Phlyctochytrium planicorne]
MGFMLSLISDAPNDSIVDCLCLSFTDQEISRFSKTNTCVPCLDGRTCGLEDLRKGQEFSVNSIFLLSKMGASTVSAPSTVSTPGPSIDSTTSSTNPAPSSKIVNPTTSAEGSASSGSQLPLIIGIAGGAVVLIAIVAVAIFITMRRRRRRMDNDDKSHFIMPTTPYRSTVVSKPFQDPASSQTVSYSVPTMPVAHPYAPESNNNASSASATVRSVAPEEQTKTQETSSVPQGAQVTFMSSLPLWNSPALSREVSIQVKESIYSKGGAAKDQSMVDLMTKRATELRSTTYIRAVDDEVDEKKSGGRVDDDNDDAPLRLQGLTIFARPSEDKKDSKDEEDGKKDEHGSSNVEQGPRLNGAQRITEISGWSPRQVGVALIKAGVAPMFVERLQQNNVTGYRLLLLTDQHLKDMNVEPVTARNMILYAVDHIAQRQKAGDASRVGEAGALEAPPTYS